MRPATRRHRTSLRVLDALTQRDYYSLFAFFNQTPVNGGGGDPRTPPVLEYRTKDVPPQVVKVMVMEDMPKPRDTFVLTRGSYEKPADKVAFEAKKKEIRAQRLQQLKQQRLQAYYADLRKSAKIDDRRKEIAARARRQSV